MTDNDATQTRQDDVYAIDELRRMLDERGIEHKDFGKQIYDDASTIWSTHDGAFIFKAKEREGVVRVYTCTAGNSVVMTPAQAIAATLGADEYAIERNVDGSYKCPICGCVVEYDIRGDDERIITMDDYVIPFNFCPKCGAKLVDE